MESEKEKLLIMLFTNLKGRKKKVNNWIEIANACNTLIRKYNFSKESLSKELSVSQETIRQILKILDNPKEIQNLIKERKIGLDVNEAIAGLKNDGIKIKVSNIVSNLNAIDARYIVQYAKKNPSASIKELEDYKEKLLKSKGKITNINLQLLAILIDKDVYRKLKNVSDKRKISVQQLVTQIIEEWLKR